MTGGAAWAGVSGVSGAGVASVGAGAGASEESGVVAGAAASGAASRIRRRRGLRAPTCLCGDRGVGVGRRDAGRLLRHVGLADEDPRPSRGQVVGAAAFVGREGSRRLRRAPEPRHRPGGGERAAGGPVARPGGESRASGRAGCESRSRIPLRVHAGDRRAILEACQLLLAPRAKAPSALPHAPDRTPAVGDGAMASDRYAEGGGAAPSPSPRRSSSSPTSWPSCAGWRMAISGLTM